MSCVDEHGREIFRLPAEFAGGDIEVYRRDLSGVLHEHSAGRAEYLFGDTITSLTQTDDAVHVDFARSASRTVDVVVGADGLHSGVRRLAFGAESRFARHLGFYLAGLDLPNDLHACPTTAVQRAGPDGQHPCRPTAPRPSHRFRRVRVTPPRPRLARRRTAQETDKRHVRGPALARPASARTPSATRTDVYFDSISRVTVPHWSAGPVALSVTPPGGSHSAAWAWAPASSPPTCCPANSAAARGDHRTALSACDNRMRGYAARWQRGANPGQFLAPPTATRLRLRNTMFKSRLIQRLLVSSTPIPGHRRRSSRLRTLTSRAPGQATASATRGDLPREGDHQIPTTRGRRGTRAAGARGGRPPGL